MKVLCVLFLVLPLFSHATDCFDKFRTRKNHAKLEVNRPLVKIWHYRSPSETPMKNRVIDGEISSKEEDSAKPSGFD